jgi:hypothetical protein
MKADPKAPTGHQGDPCGDLRTLHVGQKQRQRRVNDFFDRPRRAERALAVVLCRVFLAKAKSARRFPLRRGMAVYGIR